MALHTEGLPCVIWSYYTLKGHFADLGLITHRRAALQPLASLNTDGLICSPWLNIATMGRFAGYFRYLVQFREIAVLPYGKGLIQDK